MKSFKAQVFDQMLIQVFNQATRQVRWTLWDQMQQYQAWWELRNPAKDQLVEELGNEER